VQKDLDRLRKRKRRVHRVITILIISIVAALIIVAMRACSEQYQEPYNKEYRPMDIEKKPVLREKT